MKIHCMGKYNLNPESLPHGEHKPNAVPFKEFQDTKSLAIFANCVGIVIIGLLLFLAYFRGNGGIEKAFLWGCIASLLALFPHELLHGICFKEDSYLYFNLKQGMLFVTGPETMSKARFVFMSLLPNIIFGFIPYAIGIVFPQLPFFTVFGAFSTGMGTGDYYNVYNALTQMPKGARTYLYGFNSFWYLPS